MLICEDGLSSAIERIKPGHPEQNGRHERMHLTLKKDATKNQTAAHRDSWAALLLNCPFCGHHLTPRVERKTYVLPARTLLPGSASARVSARPPPRRSPPTEDCDQQRYAQQNHELGGAAAAVG